MAETCDNSIFADWEGIQSAIFISRNNKTREISEKRRPAANIEASGTSGTLLMKPALQWCLINNLAA